MALLKTPKEKGLDISGFFSLLLNSITQAHIFHLQSTSYSQHKALGEYYSTVEDLADKLVEAYQGAHEIVKGYSPAEYSDIKDPVVYFNNLLSKIEASSKLFTESDMLNIVDEIKTLIKQTIYKLENLK